MLGFTPWERKDEMKRQFSLLMGQKNALWWDLPARESLELNRAIYGIEPARFREIVGGLTELLDVKDKLDMMVRELSPRRADEDGTDRRAAALAARAFPRRADHRPRRDFAEKSPRISPPATTPTTAS